MNMGGLTNGLSPGMDRHAQAEGFKRSDEARQRFLADLIHENEQLQKEHLYLQHDLESERQSRRNCQSEMLKLQKQLHDLNRDVDTSAFAVALIDGDGVIFQDALLKAGDNGGSEAASRLSEEIRSHLSEYCENSTSIPVMVHVYVSMDKLGQKLASVGLLDRPNELRAFAQSFSVNQPLFSIIDVGQGKERADHRIKEMLRTFSDNPTCKHIIFGGCHDTGYLLNLDQYKHNPTKASRITLLESTPAARGFPDLPNFQRARFDTVFRTAPLPEKRPSVSNTTSGYPMASAPMAGYAAGSANPTARPFTPGMPPGMVGPPGFNMSMQSSSAAPPGAPQAPLMTPSSSQAPTENGLSQMTPRTNSVSNSVSSPPMTPTQTHPTPAGLKDASNGSSWASVGKNGVTERNISIASAKPAPRRFIIYNSLHERLDEPLPYVPRTALQNFTFKTKSQAKNFCNSYHINNGRCRNSSCPYLHGAKLTGEDLLALKYKARSLPCGQRDCTNFECYLGHECTNEREHGKCQYNNCNLRESHGMDHKPAIREFDDGKIDIIH